MFIANPNNAQRGMACFKSINNDNRDRATSWNPNPLNPWVNEASKTISPISINSSVKVFLFYKR
jgi:hypothetical protein